MLAAPQPVVVPEVNITSSAGGSEGSDVTFTVTAVPPPTADLAVRVAVSASGDFGVPTGSHTVTIPAGQSSKTLTLSTSDDSVDEPDGSVTLTLNSDSGYTVGSLSSQSVQVLDDDDPQQVAAPVVSVGAGGGVTEGGSVSFTVSADAAPAADLPVSVTVAASGDYGVVTGSRTVTIAAGTTSKVLSVATVGDSVDEVDGSVSVTVVDGADYDVGTAVATVSVADDDDPPPPVEDVPDTDQVPGDGDAPMPVSTATVSIEDASASESASELVFRVTLSEASNEDVTVQWATHNAHSSDRARGGQGYGYDFWHARGEIRIRAGETTATGAVWLNQDSRDEPDEVFTVRISAPVGATLEREEGTMTIIDDD